MRPIAKAIALLGVVAVLAPAGRAADLHFYEDAALHAVQFIDAKEGWAVGDEGVIWHSMDGGKAWERQSTGVSASLRSVHFFNPLFGWVVGREELPGGGSAGVLLFTEDSGLTWQRVLPNALPGLNLVRFIDDKVGYLAGDGSDEHPSGVFVTTDSGLNWRPAPGPRCPSWLAGAFTESGNFSLAGAWNRLAVARADRVTVVDVDSLGGRNLRGLHFLGKRAVAVGQGGLILTSEGTGGADWRFVEGLPGDLVRNCDFHAVHGVGTHFWVVGRPGTVVLHSGNGGQRWDVQSTRQPLPLNGVYFLDEKTGWAVGELGSILSTTDGGKTWQVQQRGGQRLAGLCINARPGGVPLDAVGWLGAREGYLTGALRVTAPDGASAAPTRASEGARFSAAVRRAGGTSGEMLWQLPLPSQLVAADRPELLKAWDQLHGGQAADQLLRQLVLALRIWRPDVVFTDNPDLKMCGCAADVLLVEAVRAACEQASDPKAFPEQVHALGLEPWKVTRAYARCDEPKKASVVLNLSDVCASLQGSVQEYVGAAVSLLDAQGSVPIQRGFRLLMGPEGPGTNRDPMYGLKLANGGLARRPATDVVDPAPELARAVQKRAQLRALAEMPSGLANPERLLSQVGPMLADMPDDLAARTAHAVAGQYVRLGQWNLARETYLLIVDRYPAHPLTAEAYRWLLRHNCSSEARRRHELGQFLVVAEERFGQAQTGVQQAAHSELAGGKQAGDDGQVRQAVHLANQAESRQWYRSSLELQGKLTAFGSLFTNDPALQFCLQSARRNLGDLEGPKKWYTQFVAKQPDGPWKRAATAELWLSSRSGQAPRELVTCLETDSRPRLDGKLDDACWQKAKTVALVDAAGKTAEENPTDVRLAFDREFLYVAVRCFHAAGQQVPLLKPRLHDADLREHDRVSLLFDLDRDYATCFHLQVDQRGCLLEDCWGDRHWNPRWFVSINSESRCWTAEMAIPLTALTGDAVSPSKAWAFNAIRVLPNRGVQAFSLPAEAPEEALRPEGLGLLLFAAEGTSK